MTQKCGDDGICTKRLCSPRLSVNANGTLVTRTGITNEAAYEIGMTAFFVCKPGYYNSKNWHQFLEVVICQQTKDKKSQKWQSIDGSNLKPCIKGIN